MAISTRIALALPLLATMACASSPQPAQTPVSPTSAQSPRGVEPATQGQLHIGHFAALDGLGGFVLDRSGTKPKIRIDGDKDVVELTMVEERSSGGELVGHVFQAPDGKKRVFLSTEGRVTWFVGTDARRVSADRVAEPLPAPTVAGTYSAPEPTYAAVERDLGAISVRAKNPQMKAEDASNLAKVAQAFGAADASMIVRYLPRDAQAGPAAKPAPASFRGMSYGHSDFTSDEEEGKRHAKLAKFGAHLAGDSGPRSRGNHIIVRAAEGAKDQHLKSGMPGLVWEVADTTAVFVALDGGRYEIPLGDAAPGSPIAKGAGPEAQWPAPVQDTFMDLWFLSTLAKAGGSPQATIDELAATDAEWNLCTQGVWKGAERAIDSGAFNTAIGKDWAKKATQACRKSLDKYEATMLTALEARAKERRELFEKTKARVVALGTNK